MTDIYDSYEEWCRDFYLHVQPTHGRLIETCQRCGGKVDFGDLQDLICAPRQGHTATLNGRPRICWICSKAAEDILRDAGFFPPDQRWHLWEVK